jgi:GcrA cell cycle regulator
MPAATWTEDRVRTLSTLWSAGLSAAAVAKRLGGEVTRNAVIGKLHRLGLAGRERPSAPKIVRSRPPAAPAASARAAGMPSRAPASPCMIAAAPDEMGLATLLSVRAGQCRWPLGDPNADTFRLCGRPACRGAFCGAHGALAYRRTAKDHLLRGVGP